MCSGLLADPTDKKAKEFGEAYRENDEYDKKISEDYKNKYLKPNGVGSLNELTWNDGIKKHPAVSKEASEAKQKIIDYRRERAENEKAPRPISAETVDENIQSKKKKQSKSSLGAVTKSRDRDSILSSLIKSDRNTLG